MGQMKNIAGVRFGNLIAIRPVGQYKSNKNYHWLCECDCGGIRVVPENWLQQKKVTCCKACARRGLNRRGTI